EIRLDVIDMNPEPAEAKIREPVIGEGVVAPGRHVLVKRGIGAGEVTQTEPRPTGSPKNRRSVQIGVEAGIPAKAVEFLRRLRINANVELVGVKATRTRPGKIVED